MENMIGVVDTTQAQRNLSVLKNLGPLGEGIIVGMDKTRQFLIITFLAMNAGAISQKIFPKNLNAYPVITPQKVAFKYDKRGRVYRFKYSVGNGEQTQYAVNYDSFERAMLNWDYKENSQSISPRITALCTFFHYPYDPFKVEMSVIKKSPTDNRCIREFYSPVIRPGFGTCLTTCARNGLSEIKPFSISLYGKEYDNIDDISRNIWNSLNEKSKVCMVVVFVDIYSPRSFIRFKINPLFSQEELVHRDDSREEESIIY